MANGWALLKGQMWKGGWKQSLLTLRCPIWATGQGQSLLLMGNANSHRSGDPSRDGVMVSRHPLLTCYAHKPSLLHVPGTMLRS